MKNPKLLLLFLIIGCATKPLKIDIIGDYPKYANTNTKAHEESIKIPELKTNNFSSCTFIDSGYYEKQ